MLFSPPHLNSSDLFFTAYSFVLFIDIHIRTHHSYPRIGIDIVHPPTIPSILSFLPTVAFNCSCLKSIRLSIHLVYY